MGQYNDDRDAICCDTVVSGQDGDQKHMLVWPHTDNTFLAVYKIIALFQANINFEHLLQPPPPFPQTGGRIWWFVYGESVFFQLLKNRDVFMAILSRRLMAESWQKDKPGSLQAFTGN